MTPTRAPLRTLAIDVLQAQWGPTLRGLLADPSVREVMINATNSVYVEEAGRGMRRLDVTFTPETIASIKRSIAGLNERDRDPVILNAKLPSLRVAAVSAPVAVRGSCLTIRKHAARVFTLDDYRASGGFGLAQRLGDHDDPMPPVSGIRDGSRMEEFLRWAMRRRKNLLLAGATGSGKTTFLNTLLSLIDENERIVTIEDTAELHLTHDNRVALEADEYNQITIRDLVRVSLRMRPDRIIVGEIRGGEAYDFCDAANTGHPGSLCSLHADSAETALYRLESLIRMNPTADNIPLAELRRIVAGTVQFVIFCSRAGGFLGPERIIRVDGLTPDGYAVTELFSRFSTHLPTQEGSA